MAYPSSLVRTKDWGTEILTDADLEGQLDLIINWVMAALNATTGHDHSGSSNKAPNIALTTGVTGTLPVANGGTGIASYTHGDVVFADSTPELAVLNAGTKGQCLQTQGADEDPIWANVGIPGLVQMWGGTIAGIPTGWLICDGSAVSRATYADLYSAIGDTWGEGDGSTTFNVPPDSRFPYMASSGADAGNASAGSMNTPILALSGNDDTVVQTTTNSGKTDGGGIATEGSLDVMPAYAAFPFIIKT